MKNIFIALLVFVTSHAYAQSSGTIADVTAKSVVFLVDVNRSFLHKDQVIKKNLYPLFQKLKIESFQNEDVHFLVKHITLPMRVMAMASKRKIAEPDVLVRIDLQADLTKAQLSALVAIKSKIKLLSKTSVTMFVSNNYQFHKVSGTENKDVAMAFINEWHPQLSQKAAQDYWLNHHGPLVMQVGLPPVIKSYTQIHTDITSSDGIFDKSIQGLSFESITSQCDLVNFFMNNPSLAELNKQLMIDEMNFTQQPKLFAFKEWLL